MSIVAVERALVLLKHMADEPRGLSVREAARRLGYSPAVVQKSLQALVTQGFADQDHRTQAYRLGPAALQVGLRGVAQHDLRGAARPHLEWLAAETGETAILGVRARDHVTYLDQVESSREVHLRVRLGEDRPLNSTAVGKHYLAELSDEEIAQLAEDGAFEAPTERSITELNELLTEIEQVRDTGVSFDEREYRSDSVCIAAPIRDHEGVLKGAVTVAGPVDRMEAHRDELEPTVVECGRRISAALGSTEGRVAASV